MRSGYFKNGEGNYVIISDSLSALHFVVSLRKNRLYINNMRNKIDLRDIDLFWIRAHVGDAGNEEVDKLAKEVTTKVNIDYKFHSTKYQLNYVRC